MIEDSAEHDPINVEHDPINVVAAGVQDGRAGQKSEQRCANAPGHHPLEALSEDQRDLFRRFGWGPAESPNFTMIHLAIEHWARQQPDACAAEHLGQRITYTKLNSDAEALASQLLREGVQRGDRVGLFLRRSIPMLTGILACLKIGAAYVPQDVKVVTADHIRAVCDTADIRVILTATECRSSVPALEGLKIIEIERAVLFQPDLNMPPTEPEPDGICFVLFTSGTTGKPNGVQVTHRNLANILLTTPGNLAIAPGTRVAQILSISFDMAAWEVLGTLANGGTLVIRGDDITEVAAQVDVIIATPSVLASIDIDQCHNVRTVAVAGEPCPKPLADTWSVFATFYNSCGPTETTIINTAQRYGSDCSALTIGKPTPNNTVYVLDEDMKPCKIGEPGVMWAGGLCVTSGYLNNPTLTADRYRPDPFLGGDARMFNTRDLGRWTADGELEHLGRTDDQVKVRGFRVELDGVSRVLERTSGCMKAVTIKYDNRRLMAFVSPAIVNPDAARAEVIKALPYYCEPEEIIAIQSLPLTSRGKVDKHLLMTLATERLSQVLNGVAAE